MYVKKNQNSNKYLEDIAARSATTVLALAESTFSCFGDFTAAVADVLNFIQP